MTTSISGLPSDSATNTGLNETHDPTRRSWIDSANTSGTDFPIQNLPFGIFSKPGELTRRIGVAIGDCIVDLATANDFDLLRQAVPDGVLDAPSLNGLFALSRGARAELRRDIGAMLDAGPSGNAACELAANILLDRRRCQLHLPTEIGDYTDFYAGIHHARAAGAQFFPDNPLPPNYKWVPIAYHGRASSVQASGTPTRRPLGQRPPVVSGASPTFGPSERLDLELEVGLYLSAGNRRGEPISIADATDHIVGFCLLNDWSARDIQRWEMFPLGPFLSKSFGTTVSPWVVTAEALLPFRVPAMSRPDGDPRPLSYLDDPNDQRAGGLDIGLHVLIETAKMRESGQDAVEIITSNARHLYWTPAQMVAHHTINGCDLRSGDLIGTGTISGPTDAELSSLLELTVGGARPVTLPNGEVRSFLQDGDAIILRGRCEREGFVSIGFGDCAGTVTPSPAV